jgi:hypothetical protein
MSDGREGRPRTSIGLPGKDALLTRSAKTVMAAFAFCLPAPLAAQTGAPAPAAPPAPPPPACVAPEHRQFDFWVGRWDVYPTGTHQLVAHSLIERLYGGCAIRENWMPLRGTGGGSLNSWRPAERRWRQTWIDSGNAWVEFSGGIEGEAMVLTAPSTGPNGVPALTRMIYTRGTDGSVRQLGVQSTDGGRNWQPSFDFTYVPAAG